MTGMVAIDMPADVVSAAEKYAAIEHRSAADIFAELFRSACKSGRFAPAKPKTYAELLEELTHGELPPEIKSLVGIAKLPEGKTADDLKMEYFREKYGV